MAAGEKKIETRGWATSYRGPIAIHAARVWGRDQREAAMRLTSEIESFAGLGGLGMVATLLWVQDPESWPRGCVVALGELVDCVPVEQLTVSDREASWGDYSPGRFGWLLRDVRRLERTLPLRGRQGLWGLSAAEEACVRAALQPLPITKSQIEKLEHALGLDWPDKVKDGRTWRRHFFVADGDPDMEALVAAGFMERGGGSAADAGRYYLATEAGQRAVGIREVTR